MHSLLYLQLWVSIRAKRADLSGRLCINEDIKEA